MATGHIACGDRVRAYKHDAGTVVVVERVKDSRATSEDGKLATGRVGIEFDNHTLTAKPAFFWPDELTQEQA